MDDCRQDNSPAPQPNVLLMGPVTIFACVLAAVLGGLFGDLIAWYYAAPHSSQAARADLAGRAGGAAAGLLAGALWCWAMARRVRRKGVRARLVWFGLLAGAAVGVLATAATNGALVVVSGLWGPGPLVVGAALGLLGGAFAGTVCARTWRRALTTA